MELTFTETCVYTVSELILSKLLTCKILLHERIVSLGYNLVDLILEIIDSVVVLFGERDLLRLARLIELECLTVHNIDNSGHLSVLEDRQ